MAAGNSKKGAKLFGTDGIRGVANEYPMTGEVAMAVGRAVAHVLQNSGLTSSLPISKSAIPIALKPLESNRPVRRAKIVVGKDTRLSGYMIEQAIASGICSMGARRRARRKIRARGHQARRFGGLKLN